MECRNCDNIVESDDSNKPENQCDYCYIMDIYHSMSKKHQIMLKIHLGVRDDPDMLSIEEGGNR